MRRLSIASSIAAGILALAPFSAAVAAPAPQYTSSDPADGAELHEAPETVSVTFTEPLDAKSELKVFACGKRVDSGTSSVTLNKLEVDLASGPTGKYQARWVATGFGGITGNSEGSIDFTVGHGNVSCDGSGHGPGHGSGKGPGHEGSGHQGSGHQGSEHGSGHQGSGNESSGHQGSSHQSGSGSTHSGSGHTSGSSSHGTDHSAGGNGHSGKGHGDGKEDSGHGSGHGAEQPEDAAGNPNFASNDGPLPIPTPEAGAVLLALFACVGLGITGGWLARLV